MYIYINNAYIIYINDPSDITAVLLDGISGIFLKFFCVWTCCGFNQKYDPLF